MTKTYLIRETNKFVKKSFQKNPHHSFNNWQIMYNHSLLVKKLSLKLAKHINCNQTALSIGALLHDIGKTYKADQMTLHEKHEELNSVVAEKFLKNLNLTPKNHKLIIEIISRKGSSNEMKIVKDADTISGWKDKKLYMLVIKWLLKNNLQGSLDRKLAKFENLNFEISKKIGKPWYEKMKKDWLAYMNK